MTDTSVAAQDRRLGSGKEPTPRLRPRTDASAAAQDRRYGGGKDRCRDGDPGPTPSRWPG